MAAGIFTGGISSIRRAGVCAPSVTRLRRTGWTAAFGMPGVIRPVGYGSFVRHVRIDPELVEQETVLGIYVRDVLFAYRLYVNGNLLIENGKPAAEAAGEVGSFRMRTAYFTPAGQDLEILVHVSNHHDVNSGFRHPPLLALAQRAASAGDRLRMLDLFIFGALLIMALYHFGPVLPQAGGTEPPVFRNLRPVPGFAGRTDRGPLSSRTAPRHPPGIHDRYRDNHGVCRRLQPERVYRLPFWQS
jgi:hypothetical protein